MQSSQISEDATSEKQFITTQEPPTTAVASAVNIDYLARLMNDTEVDPEAPVHRLTAQLGGSSIQDATAAAVATATASSGRDPDFQHGVTLDEQLLILAGWYGPYWYLDRGLRPVRIQRPGPMQQLANPEYPASMLTPFSVAGKKLASQEPSALDPDARSQQHSNSFSFREPGTLHTVPPPPTPTPMSNQAPPQQISPSLPLPLPFPLSSSFPSPPPSAPLLQPLHPLAADILHGSLARRAPHRSPGTVRSKPVDGARDPGALGEGA
ncbi:hypothetical protein K491DRAFT_783587 [Lophiostoma macrostomum CBS 122681]|uniref:Uncharacterized protein n=1 Tax=Lophiostoma macrostomum CBS 122681 TaxID=1314788 RepID=A0A6A6SQ45_9PLEO|nr:hypothetical protein K491DRAFT_783587 [Lophiostoma macrostomum CBS 122681]